MYFIGDTHAIRPIFNIIDKHKLENQKLIHVGDLGLGFQEIKRDISNLELLDEMLGNTGNELYVIRGNHDNPIFWNRNKGLWLPKFHNLHLVDDFEIHKIEGKNILFAGGAVSIDRIVRKDDHPPSWWKDEEFNWNAYAIIAAWREAKESGGIDIVVTHTAPSFANPVGDNAPIVNHYCDIDPGLRKDLRAERNLLTEFYNGIIQYGFKPTHWIYGHFHNTKKQIISGIEFKLLNVNELYEVN